MKIIVDNRENRSGVLRELFDLGVELEFKRLEVGDFILSSDCCVERKTVNDFINSLLDKRLFQQAKDLIENFSKPVIIIEGENLLVSRNVHPHAVLGALSSLILDFKIPLVTCDDEIETARLLYFLAKREQEKNGREISLRAKKSVLTPRQEQEFLVEGLPLIGPSLAKALLKEFKTVERVFTASEEELQRIKKIGERKAKRIREILTRKYEEK